MIYSTLVPFGIGNAFQQLFLKLNCKNHIDVGWISTGLLGITAYNWFCDAISVDSSAVDAIDILSCVLIGKLNIKFNLNIVKYLYLINLQNDLISISIDWTAVDDWPLLDVGL